MITLEVLKIVLMALACVLLIVGVALTPVWLRLYEKYVATKTLKILAGRLNGHLYGGSCCGLPSLVYEQQGQRYQLRIEDSKKADSEKMLHFTGPWPGAVTRVTIFPESAWTRAQKFMGMEDHLIGNKAFDDAFVLQSGSYSELVDLMTPNVQGNLLRILARFPTMSLSIAGGFLTLSLSGPVSDVRMLSENLATFYNLRSEMLQSVFAKLGAQEQASMREQMKLGTLKKLDATCMVCGTEVSDQRVECRRCRTAHHKDCWGYFGGCSRYGCGESVFDHAKGG